MKREEFRLGGLHDLCQRAWASPRETVPERVRSTGVEALQGHQHRPEPMRGGPAVADAGDGAVAAVRPLGGVAGAGHARVAQVGDQLGEVPHEEGHDLLQVGAQPRRLVRLGLLGRRFRRLRFRAGQRLARAPVPGAEALRPGAAQLVEPLPRLRTAGAVVDQRPQLVNHSTSRSEAWQRFDELRRTWPQRFRPWDWCPGEPLPGAEAEPAEAAPEEAEPDEAAGLRAYLEQIMAFFVRHFS